MIYIILGLIAQLFLLFLMSLSKDTPEEITYEDCSDTVKGIIDWNEAHPVVCHSEDELDCHAFNERDTICQCGKYTNQFDHILRGTK